MKSIIQTNRECYLCGRKTNIECHHILGGVANRKLSEKYGLTVYLCHDCHTGTEGAQYNKDLNLELKKVAQRAFEELYGHEMWMSVIKKNYL